MFSHFTFWKESIAEYSEQDTSVGRPLRLGDEGNPSLQPGRTTPEQTSPLVALQTDILPNLCRVCDLLLFWGWDRWWPSSEWALDHGQG